LRYDRREHQQPGDRRRRKAAHVRNAGPEGSGEPIVDNGVKGSGRRFTKTSVVEYAADKRSRDNAREDAPESDAAVAKKMRDAER